MNGRLKCSACKSVADRNDFLRVMGTFGVVTTPTDKWSRPLHDEVDLFACPTCGTLRIDHWGIPRQEEE